MLETEQGEIPPQGELLKPSTFTQCIRDRCDQSLSSILRRFAKGIFLNTGSAAAYEVIAGSGGLMGWYTGIFSKDLTDPATFSALALTTGAVALSVWANGEINLRMMRNKKMGFNSNVLSMGFYEITKKISGDQATADWSVRLASYAWDISKQAVIFGIGVAYDPNVTIGANMVGSALNFGQAGVGLWYLRSKNSEHFKDVP